jgi:S1-C subfamily serine protease
VCLVSVLSGGRAAAEDALALKTLAELKAATVFLKIEENGETANGTGFVIKTDGQTAYLVTNHHVIDMSEGKPRTFTNPKITAIFGSGTKKEQTVRAEVLANDPKHDLAVLRAGGVRDLPAAIDYGQEIELIETMPIYIFGFPLGEMLATGKGNPAITVGKGSVSSVRLNDKGDVATVQIDGDISPGNSGGPVVDVKGRLVGIAAATIRTRRIGFAIPSTELTSLLHGRVLDYHFESRPGGEGKTEVQVDLALFDPFNKMRGVTFYYVAGNGAGTKKLAGVAGVRKVELRRSQRQLVGKFALDGGGGDKPVTFQTVYVNGAGKAFVSNPRVHRFR